MERRRTDILILGSGGAGLFAAIHAHRKNPDLDITVAVKGLLGKSGCTRMVQGGYNVALAEGDSVERHFRDTIEGGKWINNQDLAWTLVNGAVERIHELENEIGCFFDRNPDGSIHQKAFAGQTFDRTVHKGDLTGIEIISRLAEQVWARDINRLEEHRAVALIKNTTGDRLAGVLLLDIRSGKFLFVEAKAVLLATGGGPTMYRYHTPSGDKSCDGMAMAMAAGLPLRDMEMVQFHPTGLVAGEDTRITGTIIEEGLRGAGGYLLNGDEERFMADYDPRAERATRDIVSRAMYDQMKAGRTAKNGGVYITMKHLDAKMVRKQFKGMVERCADCGFDLVGGLVEVVPTAHYMMGGVVFQTDCQTELSGLFAAGEDTGGVHGANRLGGNGVGNSTVFGGIAGDTMADWVAGQADFAAVDEAELTAAVERTSHPLNREPGDLNDLRERLSNVMWDDAGIIRDAEGLERVSNVVNDLHDELMNTGIGSGQRHYDIAWQDWLNLDSQMTVSKMIIAAAQAREDSAGAHYRSDFSDTLAPEQAWYTELRQIDGNLHVSRKTVDFNRIEPNVDEGSEDKP
jgi:fumarate reductase flavoprotein subunit